MENTTMSARQRLYELCSKYNVPSTPAIKIDERVYFNPYIEYSTKRFMMIEIVDRCCWGDAIPINENAANAFLNKLQLNEKFIGNCMKGITHKRFSMESLSSELELIFGCKPQLISMDDNTSTDNILRLNNQCGNFDIWFLPMNRKGLNGETLYITEVEYTLN